MTPRVVTDGTLVMGILNVTPDSFSDGGRYFNVDQALERAQRLIDEGADVLDIGAESTRPGASLVSETEEWARLEPVLRALLSNCPIPVSVDTYKAGVAERALDLGVEIVNDVWGGLADERMLSVVAGAKCSYVWMHNRHEPTAGNPVAALMAETNIGIQRCLDAGIEPDRLWLDPGIGFGKTWQHNLQVLKALGDYCTLGYPVLLGASRKGFIGRVTGGDPADRLEGSLAVVAWGVASGVTCVRVHDVAATRRTCRMVEAIRDVEDGA